MQSEVKTVKVPHPEELLRTPFRGLGPDVKESHVRDADYYLSGTALIGSNAAPQKLLGAEKAVHLTMCYLLATGRTKKEIAEITGEAYGTVLNIVKQPWFRKRLQMIVDESGRDMIKTFLEGETINSLEVLREIRDDSQEKGATRVSAANALLDRFLGKPTVHVEATSNLNISKAEPKAQQIDEELARIEAKLISRGVVIAKSN